MTDQALYVQINLWLLCGSAAVAFLLCFLPPCTRQRYLAGETIVDLPALPTVHTCHEPQVADVLLTLFYIGSSALLFAASYVTSFYPEDVEAPDITTADMWFNTFLPLIIYVPLLIRYATANGVQFSPAWKHLASTIMSLGFIYLVSIALGISGLVEWLVEVTGTPQTQEAVESLQKADIAEFLPMAVGACIVAPIVEEIFFRGFIFRVLSARVGILAGAFFSSLFFGAVHFSLVQCIILTIFGIVQCRLYVKTGSILYPMLLHFLFNSATVLQIFLNVHQ